MHATLLLGLCSAAAAKAQGTPLLAAMLLSEAATALALLGRLQARIATYCFECRVEECFRLASKARDARVA